MCADHFARNSHCKHGDNCHWSHQECESCLFREVKDKQNGGKVITYLNPDSKKVEAVKYKVVKPIFDRRSGSGNVMKFSFLPQDLQTRAHNQHAVAEASRNGKFKHRATMQRNRPVNEYIEAGIFSRGETG